MLPVPAVHGLPAPDGPRREWATLTRILQHRWSKICIPLAEKFGVRGPNPLSLHYAVNLFEEEGILEVDDDDDIEVKFV